MKEWSEGRLKAFIVSGLRSCSRRYPPKYQCLADACVGKKINKKTNRLGNHYTCNGCKDEFPSAEVQVDHIIPVVDPATGFVDWNTYIERMFCEKSNLQVLCRVCHSEKTKKENGDKKPKRVSQTMVSQESGKSKRIRKKVEG